MTNEQILKKVIEKAEENGFNFDKRYLETLMPYKLDFVSWLYKSGFYYYFIFSHEFAKAFWGEETAFGGIKEVKGKFIEKSILKEWQYHLQQLVLQENPLEYIKKFL